MKSVYNVIIWGTGVEYSKYFNLIRYEELKGNIRIIGITSNHDFFSKVDGVPYISKEALSKILYYRYYDIDYIICTECESENLAQCISWLKKYKYDTSNVIKASVFTIPYFDFKKYIEVFEQRVSIISNNCLGGVLSHQLGMKFLSPFVNMYVLDDDYILLLENLQDYMKRDMHLVSYTEENEKMFPVCEIDKTAVKLYFNHCETYEEALEIWNERKIRINYDNLFVMMYTCSKSIANKFANLPYENKILFVPFKTELECAMCIEIANNEVFSDVPLGRLLNRIGFNWYPYWDLLKMLGGSRLAERVEMRKND